MIVGLCSFHLLGTNGRCGEEPDAAFRGGRPIPALAQYESELITSPPALVESAEPNRDRRAVALKSMFPVWRKAVMSNSRVPGRAMR